MFVFPAIVVTDLIRNNIENQFSMLLNISKNFVNASNQLSRLNVQAGRKLMEESTAAYKKSMQLNTLAEAQSFFTEQSQVTIERLHGYAQNVHSIAAGNWVDPDMTSGAAVTEQAAPPDAPDNNSTRQDAAAHGQHETDPRPSALVGKLVASVAGDTDKLH
jgi:hypothetical protein